MPELLLDTDILKQQLQSMVNNGESLLDKQHLSDFTPDQYTILICSQKAQFMLDYIKSEEVKQREHYAPE